MTPLKITVLAPYVPDAKIDHAGGRFLRDWVSALSKRATVTVVAPVIDGGPRAAAADQWATVEVAAPPPGGNMQKLRNLLHFGPYHGMIAAHEHHPALPALLAASDLVEVHWTDWLPVEAAVGGHRRPVVSFAHELMADVKARQAADAERMRSRAIAILQRSTLARAERAALARCAGILTFSGRDADLMRSAGLTVPVRRVSPRLDEAARGAGPSATEAALFVGRLDRPVNVQAVRWLLDEIWPRVRGQRPLARLVLAGAGAPEWMRTDPATGVHVTGWLDDLSPVYRDARVAIAPLRQGAGLKFKVAQALVAGLPVVTTTVGADGFDELGGLDRFAAVTDDAEQFGAAIVDLLADLDRSRQVGAAAAEWANSAFNFDHDVEETLEWYETLAR